MQILRNKFALKTKDQSSIEQREGVPSRNTLPSLMTYISA